MKKVYKYFGLIIIMLCSFYYTDKIALMVQKNNPIMKQISKMKKQKETRSVNAIIEDNKIIPGKNGIIINESKSFSIMKSFGVFNSYYLVYEQKKPEISLENNKDKIIYKGNKLNNNISLVLEYNENIISYLESKKIKANVLVDKENYMNINYLELINNDFNNYNEMEIVLNRGKANKNICYTNNKEYLNYCKKKKKYLVYSDLILSNDKVFEVKNKIENGRIIFIKKDTSIDTLKIILNQIAFKDLKLVYLSEIISEENNK
ncbi:MAG: hypothetical protein E7158_05790 [Firmicutes bacterium]|nr:hypothetical protein [Bacillota bacterium]